jgi:nitrogen fixation protein FixH
MLARIMGFDKFTGWHMVAVMVLFFGTIISVNLSLAWFANKTWTGLVVKNTYVASQEFNGKTRQILAQSDLGWNVKPEFGSKEIVLNLTDSQGRKINDAIVTARIGHPAHENSDRLVQLVADQGGVYRAQTELESGIWEADISIIGPAADNWSKTFRFLIRDAS